MQKVGTIAFPEFKGLKINMMPFIQGDPTSLPDELQGYADIIENNFIEKGEIGFLTIDESFVQANTSQRGYNSHDANRNIHIEVGYNANSKAKWGNTSWRGEGFVTLEENTQVLIANSMDDTCRVWDKLMKVNTPDGDLSHLLEEFPESSGRLMKAGELFKISIFTPHECVPQNKNSNRQFFRIVGKGVKGRESYFTENPLVTV